MTETRRALHRAESRHGPNNGRGSRALILLAVTSLSRPGSSCPFDCDLEVYCGNNSRPVYTTVTLVYTASKLNSGAFEPYRTNALNALDLRARGITSIAPGGLDCFLTAHPPSDDDGAFEAGRTQVVLLDDNELTALPDLAVFGGTSIISLRNNSIGALGNGSLSTFRERYL